MNTEKDIAAAIEAHQQSIKNIWTLIRATRTDSTLPQGDREDRLSKLYSPLSVKDMREFFVADGAKFDIGVSFRSSMSNMMRVKRRMVSRGYNVAGGANSKVRDRAFAERLGVRTPKAIAEDVPASQIIPSPRTIVKPMRGAGSRGVFYIDDDLKLRSIKSGKTYDTLAAAEHEYSPLLTPNSSLNWIVEEAILDEDGNLAPDIKAYMFYGEPGVYIEIQRRSSADGKVEHSVYDATYSKIDFSPHYTPWTGKGVPPGLTEMAHRISVHTPAPFLRIDFLAGAEGGVLGEITPHPGGTYAGDLFDDVDKKLGKLFVDAQARLAIDLLEGKTFDDYFSVYPSSARRRPAKID